MKRLILIPLFSIFSVLAFGQSQSMLTHFTSDELKGDVILSWQIKAGRTCNGIIIYRSTNGQNFKEVGEIIGVCGSTLEPVNYTFVDENPELNTVNYYRLDLGGYGNSEVIERRVIDLTATFSVQPNPIVGQSKLFFENPKSKEHLIEVFDLTGKKVWSAANRLNSFKLNSEQLKKGIKFFTITENGVKKVTGKFVVQ